MRAATDPLYPQKLAWDGALDGEATWVRFRSDDGERTPSEDTKLGELFKVGVVVDGDKLEVPEGQRKLFFGTE